MQNILIVQTAFLGDLLLSVPLLKNIRRLYPSAKISLVCRKGLGSFVKEVGLVDEFFEIEKKKRHTYKTIQQQLKKTTFDILLSPHESFRTMLFCKSIQAKQKISFRRWFQYFSYTKLLQRPMQYPEALRQLSLLQAISEDIRDKFLHLNTIDWKQMTPQAIPEWASACIDTENRQSEKRICIAPGSVWNTKMWPKEYYARLVTQFKRDGYLITLIGAKEEKSICDWIEGEVQDVENLAGKTTLLDVYQIFKRSSLLVTNDSGPMHMASLVNLPTVSIFGPTVLSLGYRPWQNLARVEEIEMSCRPCGKHGHKECPIKTHDCMKKVSVEQVAKASKELLK